MHWAWGNINYLLLYLHSASVSVQVKVIVNGLFVEFLKRQTNGPMVVHSHQLIVTNKLYLFMCSLLQVCKFRVGSFNYPMNKMVFYNELIPEDTIIKSILDYKWVHNPIVGPASRSGRVQEASHFINNIACNIENKRHKKFYPIYLYARKIFFIE